MLISVIVPVYNVEKYLTKSLNSLMNQTYKDLEIICIDDCSTDSSLEILEDYVKKDSRIKVIENTSNIGAGLTRNEGIRIANGDYIQFLDPDDWLEENTFEILSEIINERKDIDIINFNTAYFNEKTKKIENGNSKYKNAPYNIVNLYEYPNIMEYYSVSSCNKLIKKKLIDENGILYNNHKTHEDVEFTLKLLLEAKNILFIQNKFYNYRTHRKNSITENRIFYIDDLIKDVKWVNDNKYKISNSGASRNIENFMYELLFINSLDAYWAKTIDYYKLKDTILNNVDYNTIENSYFKQIFHNLKNNSKVSFEIQYRIKRFIREYLPFLWNLYFRKIKKV